MWQWKSDYAFFRLDSEYVICFCETLPWKAEYNSQVAQMAIGNYDHWSISGENDKKFGGDLMLLHKFRMLCALLTLYFDD